MTDFAFGVCRLFGVATGEMRRVHDGANLDNDNGNDNDNDDDDDHGNDNNNDDESTVFK
jgi:hypothetical protein